MTLLLDSIAAYRLTKLITDDVITQPLRDVLIELAYEWDDRGKWARDVFSPQNEGDWQDVVEADEQPPKLATLITCRWCAGMWVGMFIVLARRVAPKAWTPLRDVLVLSAAAALLARAEDD